MAKGAVVAVGALCAFLFVGHLASRPEHEVRAFELRKACEALVTGQSPTLDCRGVERDALARGQAGRGYEAPVDRALTEKTVRARQASDEADLRQCKKTMKAKRAEYAQLMQQGEYWSASLVLRVCSELMEDPEIKALVETAEVEQYLKELRDPATARETRRQAIAALQREYPEAARANAHLLR
jgi:hypothetical protein